MSGTNSPLKVQAAPLSSRPGFVPLPPDPSTPLTAEQSAALWGGTPTASAALLLLVVASVYKLHNQSSTSVFMRDCAG